jgi:serine-type D-Ala-D-Ala carboxypeptidase/endopeptidase (penicillin-binding protein 4)
VRCLALGIVLVAMPLLSAAREPDPVSLRRSIDRVLDRPAFAPLFWAVEIRSLRTGRVLYERNAGKNMTPASTMKLVTTAAALDLLGPEYRTKTTLETSARLDGDGRLLGDLYLVGRGDPVLSEKGNDGRTGFDNLADALVAAGVRRIEGRLVGDATLLADPRPEDWEWADLVWCYGAEVSALAWNDNCANLTVLPGQRVADPVTVVAAPDSSYYSVASVATTSLAGVESDLTLVRDLGSNHIRLSGTYPLGAAPDVLEVALEDPALYATTIFEAALHQRGIKVVGGSATLAGPSPAGRRVLATHESPPLSELLKGINKPSNNLHAEMLRRLIGATTRGEGSLAKSGEAIAEFATRVGAPGLAGALEDGSGLSRTDMLRPHDVVDLLLAMERHPQGAVFRDSLPVAGVDGTLERRLRGTPAEGRVQAKTGTLKQTNALAGYATNRSGDRFAFSIVANHNTQKGREVVNAIDAIVILLAQ